MYKLYVKKEKQRYVLEELTKEFLRPGEYEVILLEEATEQKEDSGAESGRGTAGSEEQKNGRAAAESEDRKSGRGTAESEGRKNGRAAAESEDRKSGRGTAESEDRKNGRAAAETEEERSRRIVENEERDREKRRVFEELSELTGYRPEWGTLTGVRPAKLANELMDSGLSEEETAAVFRDRYCVAEDKISLLLETCRNQRFLTSEPAGRTVGVYIGIPFCPTRCLYCSFASNQATEEAMQRYLEALLREIDAAGERLGDLGVKPESIYVGGGTPTSLSAASLERVLSRVTERFDLSGLKEFCVEAGRPDTITEEKLRVMERFGVDRVSINPQTMNEETLQAIGRSHRVSDVREAFSMVKRSGIRYINADLIAGLPGEDYEMFRGTLEQVIGLEPDNITVHTLAVKRASRLREQNENYHYENARGVGRMVSDAREILAKAGYHPYYMYRQKHMAGNYENVSYALAGSESVYNIRIMDEHQTIVALGAGGISKAYYPDRNRLVRVPNVTNFEIYIERLDEMIGRKEKDLYAPFLEQN